MKRSIIAAAAVGFLGQFTLAQNVDWPSHGNDKAGTRYSPLAQINRGNVAQLRVAWTWKTGDSGPGTTIECTPLVVEGMMYVTTVKTRIVALDAVTGKELWTYDPYAGPPKQWRRASGGVNRGASFWSDGKPGGRRRVIVGLSDGRLVSLDAATGVPDPAFGENGVVDLRKGVTERDISAMNYGPTSPPMVFEDRIIVGCSNDEGRVASPGDPRAFDARTGKELWRFHSVPRPGEFGHDTWEPDSWKARGGANPWGGFTLDERRGILFCGTGSAGPDFYGGERKGMNLFANCVLALDARTGKRIWHFQTVHHDLFDHDNPCPPVMVDVRREGGVVVPAVAQVTKTGYCFILERETGKPVYEVQELPATPSDVEGEQAWPTQPVPVRPPPLARTLFTPADATNLSPEANAYVLGKLKELRHGTAHVPPSLKGSVITPGLHGGATWAGASFDPQTGYLFVNTNNAPYVASLKPDPRDVFRPAAIGYFNDAEGYPAMKPPWGLLTAIDVGKGEFAWQVVLGEYPELTKRGVPQTGTENFGGTIVTAGGLVFIGGTKDERFHAFDKYTGKLLWEHQLNAGGYATPSTYMVAGKQYVVIAAGGGGKPRTKSGDEFVVFALP